MHERQHGVTINTIIHLEYWLELHPVLLSPSSPNSGLGVPVIVRLFKREREWDNLMADRGFNIRHLLTRREIRLNTPSFSKGRFANSTCLANLNKLPL